ncbi:hypothetical protein [Mycobacterium angelicum]|uniref:Integral membrane protein n=1 Tax=Mycobacterium angelicum TaxID=470074 RepID=A0A1W9ZFG9_MYCAN|nr:hypothetical protein [Mycobacterium angelicum]MCV7195808.1 hypothetical protein [Mycobacterium angelicum]ORA13977.1 hypothetical protein BST12_23340 [Mycobacterium angelicum]
MLHWLQHDIVDRGRLPLLCCLLAFILTFFVTRTCVRFIRHRAHQGRPARWWHPRNVHIGTVHIHHVTFGVLLVMISGLTLVTLSVDGRRPEFAMAATLFGIGAALVLDEYALILHLADVYWEEDGRSSVDAVFAAIAVAGLLMLGMHPLMLFLPIRDGGNWVWLQSTLVGGLVFTLPLAVVVLLKGKVWTGLLGMFIVVLLVIGAIRLSRPHAPWARWRYTRRPAKMRRAVQRERTLRRPVVRAKLWLQCAIAGTPRLPDERAVDAQLDLDVHPAPPPEGTGPILIAR